MEKYHWLDELPAMAAADPFHRECQQEVEKLEPAYLRIMETLSPEDREQVDAYIAACEELEHSLIYPAYQLGRSGR